MKQRLYLDYNATAPYAESVRNYLRAGEYFEGNPSSTHRSGKDAKQALINAQEAIERHFSKMPEHKLFFHSGASEGISTFFYLSPADVMAYFESDHPAVHAMAQMCEKKGATVIKLPLCETGLFDEQKIIEALTPYRDKKIYLNYTYVHNETGIIWPLEQAVRLKQKLECFIHVDCAQAIGKIESWSELRADLDFYTFSSHKFGALKGSGFSFVKQDFPFRALIPGGGQQGGTRGGTQNVLGVIANSLALDEVTRKQNIKASQDLRDKIESLFESSVKDDGFIVLKDQIRAVNTTLLCFKKHKGDFLQIKFDMQGVDVSYGSACSSGSQKGSDTMRALGMADWERNIIRLSFGPNAWEQEKEILAKLSAVFKSL